MSNEFLLKRVLGFSGKDRRMSLGAVFILAVIVWAIFAALDQSLHIGYEMVGLVLAVIVALLALGAIVQ